MRGCFTAAADRWHDGELVFGQCDLQGREERQGLSHEISGNIRQRLGLSHEVNGNIRQRQGLTSAAWSQSTVKTR